MQYTEEHYAQMYNDLPEGLKELVLSGRLAIMVSAIGSRHGLNADQVADLEPAIEDVCLGLITKDELVDNIVKNVNVDQRVANRIAAEAELEILNPFEAELLIARKQKEDLDEKISKESGTTKTQKPTNTVKAQPEQKAITEPKDVSEHATEKKVADWYSKTEGDKPKTQEQNNNTVFDWEKNLKKKEETTPVKTEDTTVVPNIEQKLDQLTESINKLVSTRFGSEEKKEAGISTEMQELLKRLERAEKENEENKRLIRNLQTQKIDQNKIQIDKERKVDIAKDEMKLAADAIKPTKSVSVESEIVSSSVSKDTLDSILEIRNKTSPITSPIQTSTKKVLSLDELISKGDNKIKEASNKTPQSGTLVFPGVNDEKKVDIKNVSQQETLRKTLLDDLEFLTKPSDMDKTQAENTEKTSTDKTPTPSTNNTSNTTDDTQNNDQDLSTQTSSTTTNLFKDELLPKTKEERMQALQEKIKALNKGVSVGGKTNISASGLDPYKI